MSHPSTIFFNRLYLILKWGRFLPQLSLELDFRGLPDTVREFTRVGLREDRLEDLLKPRTFVSDQRVSDSEGLGKFETLILNDLQLIPRLQVRPPFELPWCGRVRHTWLPERAGQQPCCSRTAWFWSSWWSSQTSRGTGVPRSKLLSLRLLAFERRIRTGVPGWGVHGGALLFGFALRQADLTHRALPTFC